MSEEESIVNKNISEIDKILSASSQYVTIQAGWKGMLQYLPQKGINEVEKTYNGQPVKKFPFIVVDPNSGSNAEKFFDVGKRSARLIVDKLKAGHRMLKIERIGSGKRYAVYSYRSVCRIA